MTKFIRSIKETVAENFFFNFQPINHYQWIVDVTGPDEQRDLTLQLSLYDEDLLSRDLANVPLIAHDLIELATAVYTVDRSIQPGKFSHCTVNVRMPVRCPDILQQQNLSEKLKDILYWYTGYEWVFEFTKRTVVGRASEYPQLFDWYNESCPAEFALWSGGLDCLAGLYNRADEDPSRQFVLCGTGGSNNVHNLQKYIVDLLPPALARRVKLSQVRYSLETVAGQLPGNLRLRSRGFTFTLIGSICAYLGGSHALQVYENGIGAINLRFRESEIGLNHAHSVHPLSLMSIAEWLSEVFGEAFKISNPYFFQTKAQMCEIFTSETDLNIAFETETCDRKHRKPDAKQCGRCSSCILRRQAFAALGVQDQTPYVYTSSSWLYEEVDFETINKGNHIPAVLYQVHNLHEHLRNHNPWKSLVSQYETLAADIVDRTSAYFGLSEYEMCERLMQLFSQYVNEWNLLKNQTTI